jgi:exodeoxyribonuclease I
MTFFFYDLETSGFHPRNDRIMQFAGQRTTLDLEPIGEPYDCLIRLTEDILPDPDAILVTGITPQRTKEEGYTEREFAKILTEEIATPETIFVGYNTLRFDDEFMRALLYRNLHDPYEWQWADGNSRWDLLDVVRMTRALRPDGIVWPTQPNGAKANRLELLTAANGIDHTHAHNAMSDVLASIEVAKLLKKNQPKLFEYLLDMREKNRVRSFVSTSGPFVYSSGTFHQDYEKTTIVTAIATGDPAKALVYDLRVDPEEWLSNKELPVRHAFKVLKYNHCPAIAPLGVLTDASWSTIQHTPSKIQEISNKVLELRDRLLEEYEARNTDEGYDIPEPTLMNVDSLVYAGFFGAKDKKIMVRIRDMSTEELTDFHPEFEDRRLDSLYFLYRARQMPKSLLAEDREAYEQYILHKFTDGESAGPLGRYMARLNELARAEYLDADKRYVLEELALYAESIVPA